MNLSPHSVCVFSLTATVIAIHLNPNLLVFLMETQFISGSQQLQKGLMPCPVCYLHKRIKYNRLAPSARFLPEKLIFLWLLRNPLHFLEFKYFVPFSLTTCN